MAERRGGDRERSADGVPEAGSRAARERILDAFAARASRTGIRSVVMGELASALGMSKRTLYREFDNKEALVVALVERFVARNRERARRLAADEVSPAVMLARFAESWSQNLGSFSREFWEELRRDYPDADATLRTMMEDAKRRARRHLARHLRARVSPAVAAELLQVAIAHFNDPEVGERLGLTRSEALRSVLDVWVRGALGTAPGDDG